MIGYIETLEQLRKTPKTWLVTGVAGFIGSNLLEALLKLDQFVVGLDNFSSGHRHNLEQVQRSVEGVQWNRFSLIEGDIRNLEDCQKSLYFRPSLADDRNNLGSKVDFVLHHAALASVPKSIEDPSATNEINVTGFLNMLIAARDAGVGRFVYASSSAVYGDSPEAQKVEEQLGRCLSPYALSKYINEVYADLFFRTYRVESIGLRYFNVFGRRQDPEGAYAAVIPKWISTMLKGQAVHVNGDGSTTRDFCFIDNIVQMNLLAATTTNSEAVNQIYNVGVGESTSLNELYLYLSEFISSSMKLKVFPPVYRNFLEGDIRHSLANIQKATNFLKFKPEFGTQEGLKSCIGGHIQGF